MSGINAMLNERLSNKPKGTKMGDLARKTARGDLNGFSGLFGSAELTQGETETLQNILTQYATDDTNVQRDLTALMEITSEVKAINNQAALLHGERIKRANSILKSYEEGAFTAWLVATYGNRQTPYNLWQYYEFYHAVPKKLQPQIDSMPRQAVYSLASREGELNKKIKIVEEFDGETKSELLNLIRERFPLSTSDRRRQNIAEGTITSLERIFATLRNNRIGMTKAQKEGLLSLLGAIQELVRNAPRG
ncbi:MAG: CT583 family protein [Chlamydiales bacterium]|nr:CT583 family protein [Chlamydiales bacterium]